MKRRKLYNLKFLTLFQVLIFVTPLFIKGVHSHAFYTHKNVLSGVNLVQGTEPCPVCNYEFVTLDKPKVFENKVILPFFSLENVPSFSFEYSSVFQFKAVRAPPIV